jgi:hypothetical protein
METNLYALFNKNNKKFVCFSIGKDNLPPGMLYKEIEIEGGFNLDAYEWEGDYDNGQFIDKSKQQFKVSEIDLQKQMYDIFFRRYEPVYVLMNIINTLLIQREKDQLPWIDESMSEMLDFYKKLLIKTENDAQYYRNSKFHKYVTKKEINDDFHSRLE